MAFLLCIFSIANFRWMTKKVIRKENLDDRTTFFLEPSTKIFSRWLLDRPPTKIGRHNDIGAGLYLCLNIFSIGQAAMGPRKIFNSKRGPQPKKFGNRCSRVGVYTGIVAV